MMKNHCRWITLFVFLLLGQASVRAQLSAQFSATTVSGCAPIIVQFKDETTGSPTEWRWDLGNGVTSFLQNPSTTYFNPGTYNIKLVVRSANGVDSVVKRRFVTVHPNPQIDFIASDSAGCFPLPVRFSDRSTTASGAITSWSWDFGDGSISNLPSPSHTYTSPGNYDVTLKVSNSFGCSRTASKVQYIKVSYGVQADFTHQTSNLCQVPLTVEFKNTSSGPGLLRYIWNFGDGATSNEPNPVHTYTTPGYHTVSLVAISSQGCRDTLKKANLVSVGTIRSGFSVPDTICEGRSFVFSNTTTPTPLRSIWFFGDGTSSTEKAPRKSYSTPGAYTIKLVNDFGGCADSTSRAITVSSKTVPEFTANKTASCKTPFTVSFTNTTKGNNTYKWDFGDGATSSDVQPVHTYTAAGYYNVTLIAFNEKGCSDTLIKKEYLKIEKPVVTLNNLPQSGCTPLTITPTASIKAHEPVTGYLWDFGDGTQSSVIAPSHTYAKPGTYNVTLTVTTQSGCAETVTVPNAVRVGDKPEADFTLSRSSVCASDAVQFTDRSIGNIDQWLWGFDDSLSSIEQNPSHVFGRLGKRSVTLVVWSNTCSDTIVKSDIVDVLPPLALYNVKRGCSDKYKVEFENKSVGAKSWQWDFGDGTISTEEHATHKYAMAGIYKLVLKVTNGACSNINWSMVNIVDEKAAFKVNITQCRGVAATFTTPTINPANIVKWHWNFGDGTTSAAPSTVSHIYKKAGLYTATLTITDILGCSETQQQQITVYGPTADFISDKKGVCLGASSIAFTNRSATDGVNPLVKSIWNFGDGAIDSTATTTASHLYTKAGEYTVSLQVVDAYGCSNKITRSNSVIIAQPKAAFSSPDTLSCINAAIRFVNQSSAYDPQYQWTFGDGSGATGASPTHQYRSIGQYSVGLVVKDRFGCVDSVAKDQYINISLPQASFTVSDSVSSCPPLLVHFANASTNAVSLKWHFGDGNSSTLANPSHYYTKPGVYWAKLIVTGPGGCTDTATRRIEVKGPSGSFSYTPAVGCNPVTVGFRASATNNVSFVWDFADGTTLTTRDSVVKHTYTIPGEYVPRMILVDATGCTVSIVGRDTIKVIGITAGFTLDNTRLCNSGTISFTNTTISNDLITSYEWSFGDGTRSSAQHPSHTYTRPGVYTVQLRATTQTGCQATAVLTNAVTVFEGPGISLIGDSAACLPATLAFSGRVARGEAGALGWNWNFGNGQRVSAQNPAPQYYNKEGAYAVWVTATDKNGCRDSVAKTVNIHALPRTEAGPDVLVCRDSQVQLRASGADTYAWQPAPGLGCTTCATPVAGPLENTTYYVTGYNRFGCSTTDSVKVAVRQKFNVTANPGITICAGESVSLLASGADNYYWSPAAGLNNASGATTVAMPSATTLYKVVGRDRDNCFTDTAEVLVRVNPLPSVEAGPDRTASAGTPLPLQAAGSADITSWQWSPGAGLSCTTCPAPEASPRQATKYTVTVRNEFGCAASDNLTVSVVCNNGNLFIPNTFSPNGDGANDRFYPRGTGIGMIRSLVVFNRWGEVVFERRNFNANDAASGWDGTYKGQKLSPDVFIYSCEVVCINNEVLPFKGDVTLLR